MIVIKNRKRRACVEAIICVRVEGQGKAVITDVIYSSKESSNDELTTTGSKEELERIKEEISETVKELRHLQIRREVLNKEKELINKFSKHVSTMHTVEGSDHSLSQLVDGESVSVVIELFQRVESKLSDLDSRLSVIAGEEKCLQDKLAVLQANADKLNPKNKKATTETLRTLHVSLEAAEEGEAILFVSYIVTNASWSSSYDVRVFTKDKTMKVQYYGLIQQVTGEDWENAKISLSTAQPSVGGSAPPLNTKIIRFKRPNPRRYYAPCKNIAKRSSFEIEAEASFMGAAFSESYDPTIEDSYGGESLHNATLSLEDDLAAPGGGGGQETFRGLGKGSISPPPPPPALEVATAKVTAGLFNTTYAIPRATTIPADNTEHKVTIALVDLVPELTYSSVPRLFPHSFLQAKATNSSPYTILAGPANVFLDNNFIAKSTMSDVSPGEEFVSSLGADQSIRITVRPVATVHNTRTAKLGGAKTNTITYTHTSLVKNTRSDYVNIKVSEQVPLSTDDRIKVSVVDPAVRKVGDKFTLPFGHVQLNKSHNMEWHAALGAGSECELKLIYTVEHPAQDGIWGIL
ncbi:protein F37C4.5-like isoform X2 [Halichondria panicea]|uniref:protein F37C4.5-like isoform X2 n=1 Tax=Halichondria panicea TaxID=6063 RepID=UPI00312B785E